MKEFFEVFNGNFLAYLGVAFAVIFSGIGSHSFKECVTAH